MWRMLQQPEPRDYVVASGNTHSVRELCEVAFARAGLDWEKYVVIDERFYRPAEVDLLVGDATKAHDRARLVADDDVRGARAPHGRPGPGRARVAPDHAAPADWCPGTGTCCAVADIGGCLMHKRRVLLIAMLLLLSSPLAVYLARPAAPAASTTTDQTVGMPKSAINLAAVPLGTGKSSTAPKVGYLDRCGGTPSGGPPVSIPPWVNTTAGSWNAKTKVAVEGNVSHVATFKATHTGANEVITGNGLPGAFGHLPGRAVGPGVRLQPRPGLGHRAHHQVERSRTTPRRTRRRSARRAPSASP